MFRKMASVALSVILVFSIVLPVAASTSTPAKTFKEVVNEMELKPVRVDWLCGSSTPEMLDEGKALVKSVDNMIAGKITNYDKLVAIYNSVVNDPKLNEIRKTGNNCTNYAQTLYEALTIAGFMNYQFRGYITTASGGKTEHSWNAVEVNGRLYFMDAFMTASGGKNYFLVSQKNATMYSDIFIWQVDVGWRILAREGSFDEFNTAEKRKIFAPLLDITHDAEVYCRRIPCISHPQAAVCLCCPA